MNYKLILLTICIVFWGTKTHSQQTIVASGGNDSGSGGSSSNSIGQITYISANGSNGSINQGVQQPFEIVTLGKDDFPEITLQMMVYPNPTSSFLNLRIENYTIENLQYSLFNINGKEISSQKIENPQTQINMNNLPSALYLLKVIEEGKLLKTFKIIKNQ